MRQAGISGLVPRKRGRTTISVPGVRVADDLVERHFRPDRQDVLWVADVTYLRTWEGWLFLAAVQDAGPPPLRWTPCPPKRGRSRVRRDRRSSAAMAARFRARPWRMVDGRPGAGRGDDEHRRRVDHAARHRARPSAVPSAHRRSGGTCHAVQRGLREHRLGGGEPVVGHDASPARHVRPPRRHDHRRPRRHG